MAGPVGTQLTEAPDQCRNVPGRAFVQAETTRQLHLGIPPCLHVVEVALFPNRQLDPAVQPEPEAVFEYAHYTILLFQPFGIDLGPDFVGAIVHGCREVLGKGVAPEQEDPAVAIVVEIVEVPRPSGHSIVRNRLREAREKRTGKDEHTRGFQRGGFSLIGIGFELQNISEGTKRSKMLADSLASNL